MSALSISKIEFHVFQLTNRERRRRGLKHLRSSRPIGRVAREHSRDMSRRNYLSHETRGTGETPTDRARNAGLGDALAENIAQTWRHTSIIITRHNTRHYRGLKDERAIAASLVRMWMNSTGHRDNILNGSHDRIGVGVWVNFRTGKVHATQNFALRQPKPESLSSSLSRSVLLISGIIITIIVLVLSGLAR